MTYTPENREEKEPAAASDSGEPVPPGSKSKEEQQKTPVPTEMLQPNRLACPDCESVPCPDRLSMPKGCGMTKQRRAQAEEFLRYARVPTVAAHEE